MMPRQTGRTGQNSKWMELLDERLTHVPLFKLAIPGSHDSITSSFDLHQGGKVDVSDTVKFLDGLVNQSMSMLDQLNSGVRFLDLRVYKMNGTNEYRFGHGIYGDEVKVGLKKIKPFFEENNREIVIVRFNRVDHADLTRLRVQIRDILGDLLIPEGDLSVMTLAELWKKPGRIILNADDTMGDLKFLTGEYSMPKKDYLDNQHRPGKNHFYVRHGFFKPMSTSVDKDSSLETFTSSKTERFALQFQDEDNGPSNINICMVDFLEKLDYIEQVIKLNEQLLEVK